MNAHGYTRNGCRCPDCRAEHAYIAAAWRDREASKPKTGTEPYHGTQGGYVNHGCRSECCLAAKRAYRQGAAT